MGAKSFGRYRIVRTLAFGGMAQLLVAIDATTERTVVLKRILPQYASNPEFVKFFVHEGRLGLRLKHPNIVETIDAGRADGMPFIALEYLRGAPAIDLLRAAARAHVELPLGVAVRIVADTARGLHFAHLATDYDGASLDIVHRDVTPHNLFVGKSGQTKVLDFGIAKATSQLHQTRAGTIKGKFAYLAPEQIRGLAIDHRVDVFALGIVLHELLTLKPLFRGTNDGDTMNRVMTLDVPPPERVRPGVPPGLGAVALRALSRDRDRRLPSCQALADAIEAVAHAECIDASPEVVAELVAELCPVPDEPARLELDATPAGEATPEVMSLDDDLEPLDGTPSPLEPARAVPPRIPSRPPPPPPASLARSRKDPSGEQPAGQLVGPAPRAERPRSARNILIATAGFLALGMGMGTRSCRPVSHETAAPSAPMATPNQEPGPKPEPEPRPRPEAEPEAAASAAAAAAAEAKPAAAAAAAAAAGQTSKAGLTTIVAPLEVLGVVRPGGLRLVVTPRALVTVDGRPLGATPLAVIPLSPGPHVVGLRNARLGVTTTRHVVIAPERETRLHVDLFGAR